MAAGKMFLVKTARKGQVTRRRRYSRRPRRMMIMRKPTGNRVHAFKARWLYGSITGTGTTNFLSANFQLSQVPNSTSYTALFDSYRISSVKLTFVYRGQNSSSQPVIYIVTDHDDSGNPTTINSILERAKSRILTFSNARNVQSHGLIPAVATGALQSTTLQPGTVSYKPWLDTAYPSVGHFGVKYAVDNLLTGSTIDVFATMYFQTRENL